MFRFTASLTVVAAILTAVCWWGAQATNIWYLDMIYSAATPSNPGMGAQLVALVCTILAMATAIGILVTIALGITAWRDLRFRAPKSMPCLCI